MFRLTTSLAVLVVLVGVGQVWATPVNLVQNPSFEVPMLVDGAHAFAIGVPFWEGGGSVGAQNLGDKHFPGASDQQPDLDTPIPDGRNTGFVEDSSGPIFQNLTEPLLADVTYTLSAWFGNRFDRGERSGPTGYDMRLIAGGTTIASIVGTLPDGWTHDATTASVTSDHPAIGEPLRIEIWRRLRSAQINFDSVSLTYIPEPSALVLLSIGAVGLLFQTRRKTTSERV